LSPLTESNSNSAHPGNQALVESFEAAAFGRFANRRPERVLTIGGHVRLEHLERLTERGPEVISEQIVSAARAPKAHGRVLGRVRNEVGKLGEKSTTASLHFKDRHGRADEEVDRLELSGFGGRHGC
jgi:hypothetical protein